MAKENKEVLVTFRCTEKEFEPYQKIIDGTGISRSALMRQVFIAKKGQLVEPKQPQVEKKRVVFLANKASNNINQLAKRVHQAYRGGIVSEQLYRETLNMLVSIEKAFAGAIKNVSKG